MKVGLYQASPERCKETGLQWPQTKSPGIVGADHRGPLPQAASVRETHWDLTGAYPRRINIQHRLVYQVLEEERVVKVLRLWSHYE